MAEIELMMKRAVIQYIIAAANPKMVPKVNALQMNCLARQTGAVYWEAIIDDAIKLPIPMHAVDTPYASVASLLRLREGATKAIIVYIMKKQPRMI